MTWHEDDHPRGGGGKFVHTGRAAPVAALTPPDSELVAQVLADLVETPQHRRRSTLRAVLPGRSDARADEVMADFERAQREAWRFEDDPFRAAFDDDTNRVQAAPGEPSVARAVESGEFRVISGPDRPGEPDNDGHDFEAIGRAMFAEWDRRALDIARAAAAESRRTAARQVA